MKKYILLTLVVLLNVACAPDRVPEQVTGPSGPAGSSCSVSSVTSPRAGSLITCTDGTSSLVLNGTNGVNGANGTIVNPVRFCKSTPSSYPTVFSEVGFCINNILYSVYSANDGFLTALPNGTYNSDGINSSCSFTVNGCIVTDL